LSSFSGVGKTSLTHLIAHNEALTSPGWTVGCSVEVKLHEYKEGTPSQNTFFVELWDVGGSISHKNTRHTFYTPTHGIILVHDLTNKKSHDNLQKWLMEIINKEGKDSYKGCDLDIDPEQFLGSTQVHINCGHSFMTTFSRSHIN
jgi:Rab-like protein 3